MFFFFCSQRIDCDPNVESVEQKELQHIMIIKEPLEQQFVKESFVEALYENTGMQQGVQKSHSPKKKAFSKGLTNNNGFCRFNVAGLE